MQAPADLTGRRSRAHRLAIVALTGTTLALLAILIPACVVCHGFYYHRKVKTVAESYDSSADRWRSVPRLPEKVAGARAVSVGGMIYVVGGGSSKPGSRARETLFQFDPVQRDWTRLADMPTARAGHGVAAVGTDIYVLGGTTDPDGVEVFDTMTGLWTIDPDMPNGHAPFTAVAIGSVVYAPGGGTDLFDALDTTTGIWTPLTPMPVGLADFAIATDGSSIFIMGGDASGFARGTPSDDLWIYDVATDGWSSGPDMPELGNYLGATIDGARLFLLGTFGSGNPGRFDVLEDRRRVLVLNVASLFWADGKPKRDNAYGVASAAEGGLIYVFGGWGKSEKRGCGA